MTLIHATGVFLDGKGIVITGPSGAGKSDLALRLMALGAELIGDDYVEVAQDRPGRLVMQTPKNIAGKIEVRHVGILEVAFRPAAEIDILLTLTVNTTSLERLPLQKTQILEGVPIPCLDFYAFEASAPEKLKAALKILLPE